MMKDLKVVFMGTPEFAVPVLDMLIKTTDVKLVVSQPDKMVGRKKEIVYSPIKELAISNNIEVFQPYKIREDYQRILDIHPDIIITCAYGQIIPKVLLDAPRLGCVNVHASALPKLRGGAPLNHAIIDGYKSTGVTIMYMDEKMDNGDIIKLFNYDIKDTDTYDDLVNILSVEGANLLKEVLPSIIDGTNDRIKQDENEVTFAWVIKREDEHIDFNEKASVIHNKIRGLSSIPGSYSVLDDLNIKIYLSSLDDCENSNSLSGTVTRVSKDGIFVACKDKEIKLLKIQVPGKKPMLVRDYLNGINKEELIGKAFQ